MTSTTVKCINCKVDCDFFICETCRHKFGDYVSCHCSEFFMQDYRAIKDGTQRLLNTNSPDDQVRVYWYSTDLHEMMYIGDATLEKLQNWRWGETRSIIKNYFPHSLRDGSQMIIAIVKSFEEQMESRMPQADCLECHGTGKYVGFNKVEDCSLCQKGAQRPCG